MLIAGLAGLMILFAVGAYLFSGGFTTDGQVANSSGKPLIFVDYTASLVNFSNESYLGFDIINPQGMPNEIEMRLPPNIDQSISAQGE